jgi:hypothetical protein
MPKYLSNNVYFLRLKSAVHANVHNKVSDKPECFKIWNRKEMEGPKGWEAHKVTFFVPENMSALTNEFYIAYTVPCYTASTIKTQ